MYCFRCGKPVKEGKAYCRDCGAPIPAVPKPRVRQTTAAIQRRKAGAALAIALLCLVLLVGGGYLVYDIMGNAPPTPPTTVAGASGAGAVSTSTTLPASTTTSTTAVPTTSTTAVPTTSTTAIPTTETTLPATTETTAAAPALGQSYLTAAGAVVQALTTYVDRIPQLGDQIGASAPNVPRSVFNELNGMLKKLQRVYGDLRRTVLPSAFEDSDRLLDEAATYMGYRMSYALQGIQAMWDTGQAAAADASFAKARDARDRAIAALDAYEQMVAMR